MNSIREIQNVFLKISNIVFYRKSVIDKDSRTNSFFNDFYSSKIVSDLNQIHGECDLINVLEEDLDEIQSNIKNTNLSLWIEIDTTKYKKYGDLIYGNMKEFYFKYFLSDCSA